MSTNAQKRWQMCEVVRSDPVADGVRAISLRFPGRVPSPIEGAHVDVEVLIDGLVQTRSYSVVRREPDDRRTITLGVQLQQSSRGGSRYMHGLPVGARLRATQPLVTFPFTLTDRPLRFLAGGIGITALAPMAATCARRPPSGGYLLTYVARTRARMAFLDELHDVHGNAFDARVDDEDASLDVAAYLADLPEDTVLYMCGPVSLMEDVRAQWALQGRDLRDCRFETFGTAGRYPAVEFVACVPRLGLEVTVPAGRSLMDALEDHGAELLSDCRKGECGVCRVTVLGVRDGLLDHRDVFLSAAQHKIGNRLCPCVSRAYAPDPERTAVVRLDLP